MNTTGKTLLTFFTGAAAGVVAGLLLAPKSGADVKSLLSDAARSMKTGEKNESGMRKEPKQPTVIPIEHYSRVVGS